MSSSRKQDEDCVSVSFKGLIAALECHSDDIKLKCAEAAIDGDFETSGELLNRSKAALLFRQEVMSLSMRWSADAEMPASASLRQGRSGRREVDPALRQRSKSSRLLVSVGGKDLVHGKACDVFAAAIEEIGLERVSLLNMSFGGTDLVSRQPTTGYRDQRLKNGWYVTTHFSNGQKKDILESIGKALRIPIAARLSPLDNAEV